MAGPPILAYSGLPCSCGAITRPLSPRSSCGLINRKAKPPDPERRPWLAQAAGAHAGSAVRATARLTWKRTMRRASTVNATPVRGLRPSRSRLDLTCPPVRVATSAERALRRQQSPPAGR
jgi:hypothetical protein